MPTKILAQSLTTIELVQQSKDLLHALRRSDPDALQRVPEFQPVVVSESDELPAQEYFTLADACLLYTSPSPRDS